MTQIKIRKAVEKDYKIIDSIYRESYKLHFKAIPDTYKKTPQKIFSRGKFISILEDNDFAIFVAEAGEQIVGAINVSVEEENGGYMLKSYRRVAIDELSVSKDFQHQGIGKVLMQEAEKWAKKKKITDLTVLVYSFNKGAIKFYEKNGYQPYSLKLNKKISKK